MCVCVCVLLPPSICLVSLCVYLGFSRGDGLGGVTSIFTRTAVTTVSFVPIGVQESFKAIYLMSRVESKDSHSSPNFAAVEGGVDDFSL